MIEPPQKRFFSRFLAAQLARPDSLFGRCILLPLWNRRNRALNDMVFSMAGVSSPDRLLEIGFGGGYLLKRLAPYCSRGICVGCDHSPVVLRHARALRNGPVRLWVSGATVEHLPFCRAAFTCVVSVNSLFYWTNHARAFGEVRRVLQPGGELILCFTCRSFMEHKAYVRHGVTLFDADQAIQLLQAQGFTIRQTVHGKDRSREFVCIRAGLPL